MDFRLRERWRIVAAASSSGFCFVWLFVLNCFKFNYFIHCFASLSDIGHLVNLDFTMYIYVVLCSTACYRSRLLRWCSRFCESDLSLTLLRVLDFYDAE